MNLPRLFREDNSLYLVQDLQGLDTYERAKAIVNFCDKESKQFEKEIDKVILEILERNGVNICSTDKSVLKKAFDILKGKGTNIEVMDLYKNNYEQLVKYTKNQLTIVLESNRYLELGVMVKEIDL